MARGEDAGADGVVIADGWARSILAAHLRARVAINPLTREPSAAPQALTRPVSKTVVHRRHGIVIHACFTQSSCVVTVTFHAQVIDFITFD